MKKTHLSRIVSGRTLTTIMAVFAALVAVIVMLVYSYAERKAEGFVRFCLEDMRENILDRVMDWYKSASLLGAEDYDRMISEFGLEYMKKDIQSISDADDDGHEVDVIDPDGIVIASSDQKNIGYDIRSGERSAEFLKILNGETDAIVQELKPGSPDGTLMLYCGALMPEYGGIYLEGYDQKRYSGMLDNYYETQVRNDTVGRKGYYLYLNGNGEVTGKPDSLKTDDVSPLSHEISEYAGSGRIVKEKVYGVSSYVGVSSFDNSYLVAVYPVSEAREAWNFLLLILLIIYVFVFTLLFILIRYLIDKEVVQGVYSINGSLSRITAGNLKTKADFRRSVEFDGLSDGINSTVDRLKELIKEAEGRIDAELALASRIQLSFLPHEFPAFPDRKEFELFASMVPAREVGGDFYDYFLIDDDHLALVMADVSGKGLPAALFMVMARDRIRHSVLRHGTDVAEAVREVNLELIEENDAGLFVTVWLGVFNLITGHMDYVDAGHEYPALCRANGGFTVEEDVHCAPVAARKKARFEAGSFELKPGDILYLYTDGVTEANAPDGEMFKRKRMLDALNRNVNAYVQDMDAAVRAAVADFVKDAPLFDDTTTLCFKYRGKETGGGA